MAAETGEEQKRQRSDDRMETDMATLKDALLPAMTAIYHASVSTGVSTKVVMAILWQSVLGEDPAAAAAPAAATPVATAVPTPEAKATPTAAAAEDPENEVLMFGKHRGKKDFRTAAAEDPEYVKWVLTNTDKGSYPQMKTFRAWLGKRYDVYKPAKSAPAMLRELSTGKAMTGPLKGSVIPGMATGPGQPTCSLNSTSQNTASGGSNVDPEELAKKIVEALRSSMKT